MHTKFVLALMVAPEAEGGGSGCAGAVVAADAATGHAVGEEDAPGRVAEASAEATAEGDFSSASIS